MNRRLLSLVILGAVILVPTSVANASALPLAKYVFSEILPPGATEASAGGIGDSVAGSGNAMNSEGDIGGTADFGQTCGDEHGFVFLRKSGRYVVLGAAPAVGIVDTDVFGIADDGSVGVDTSPCSGKQTFFYQVTSVDTTPQWSQPCACLGDYPVGYNSDGVGLNTGKRGPAVLSFPSGAPNISPLTIKVGVPAKAWIDAVGTPGGFVGAQRDPKTHRDLPTVWLDGTPYVLPAIRSKWGPSTASAMDERQTPHGLRIDVVGTFYHGDQAVGVDYWQGRPTAGGFHFAEKRHYVKSPDLLEGWGISTNGSAIFGDYYQENDLIVYFTASHRERDYWGRCTNYAPAWGDSHGDILVQGDYYPGMCLAQPEH